MESLKSNIKMKQNIDALLTEIKNLEDTLGRRSKNSIRKTKNLEELHKETILHFQSIIKNLHPHNK